MKKTFLISVLFLLLSISGYAQSAALQESLGFQTITTSSSTTFGGFGELFTLYPTVSYFNCSSASAYPHVNNLGGCRVRMKYSSAPNWSGFNWLLRVSYVGPGQINVWFVDDNGGNAIGGNTFGTTVDFRVERFDGSNWVTERDINGFYFYDAFPSIRTINGTAYADLYDAFGNYLKHVYDGTPNPKTSGGSPTYLVFAMNGLAHDKVSGISSDLIYTTNIQGTTESGEILPYTTYEGVKGLNFPVNPNNTDTTPIYVRSRKYSNPGPPFTLVNVTTSAPVYIDWQ